MVSYSLTSDQSNSSKEKDGDKSHASASKCCAIDSNVGIPSSSSSTSYTSHGTDPPSRLTNHEDPLINLLNGCGCCSVDLLAQRLHSNSLMALFLTPLTGHPLVTPGREDIESSEKNSSFNSSSPVHSSSQVDSSIQYNSQSIPSGSCSPPFTKLHLANKIENVTPSTSPSRSSPPSHDASASATSIGAGISNSTSTSTSTSTCTSKSTAVQRDCLTYVYPDSTSCTCPRNDREKSDSLPHVSHSCLRDALIAKLKGMFITLCHVTSDITNQLPITCTISLEEPSNISSCCSKCIRKKDGTKNEHKSNSCNVKMGKTSTRHFYGGQFNSGHQVDANASEVYDGCSDEYCNSSSCCYCNSSSKSNCKGTASITRKYSVAFIHEFTSILVLAVPEWIDCKIIPVTSLITSFSQMIRFSFASLDAAFKNRMNHKFINSYLDLVNTMFLSNITFSKYTSPLKRNGITLNTSSTIMSPVMGLVHKIPVNDDELYTEISDKLSEYETKDWTRYDCNYIKKQEKEGTGDGRSNDNSSNNVKMMQMKSDRKSENDEDDEQVISNEGGKIFHQSIPVTVANSIPGGCPGDFLVVGSMLFQKGYLIHSHVPFYFQPDLINFVKLRGLLDLTSRHSCKLVVWQEVHPTGSNKHLIHLPPSASNNTYSTFLGQHKEHGNYSNRHISNSIDSSFCHADTFDSLNHDALDYSAHSGRFFILTIGIKHTLFTVLLEVPFIFSTEPIISPNEAIILQSIRFVISSLQRSGLTDEINDHLLLQSLAQFSHEECLAKCIKEEKKSITARTLLKSAKSLRDLLSFSTNDTSNKEEMKHSENELRNSLNQIDDLSRTVGGESFFFTSKDSGEKRKGKGKGGGGTNEPDESVTAAGATCVTLVNSQILTSGQRKTEKSKGKALKCSKKNSSLKKTQSSPSLSEEANTSHWRHLVSQTNCISNYEFSSQHVSSHGTPPMTGSVFSEGTTVSCSGFSCKSLASEYREKLSSLLPKNVLLFTDLNMKTGTYNSSILAPAVDDETLFLREEDEVIRMHKRNKCRMNHRLSFLILPKYREAMICLNRHLDEMPLVKECGLSFVLPSVEGQIMKSYNHHDEYCEEENGYIKHKGTTRRRHRISGKRSKNTTRKTGEDNRESQFHHDKHHINDFGDVCDSLKDGRNSHVHHLRKSTSNVNNDECNAYSQASETFSSSSSTISCSIKSEEREYGDKLTYDSTALKATYWVSAYRESPIRTLFACFVLPKDTGHKLTTKSNSSTSSRSNNKSTTASGSNINQVTNHSINTFTSINNSAFSISYEKVLDSGLISMESIAYALEVANKEW